jgi:uncharacterized protein YqgC (DUF456 family)
MFWLYYSILFLTLLSGLAITLMTLPGLWVMLVSALLYGWATHWHYIGRWTLIALFLMAAVAEAIELFSSGAGAKKAGGGRPGLIGALVGGILGGIFLSFVPIPIISTLIGVCLGTFLGATLAESVAGRELQDSALIGLGAAKGRLFGTFIKVGFGGMMFILTMIMGLPVR